MHRWYLLFVVLFTIYCPKQVVPRVDRIEVCYLSSLAEDLKKDIPLLSGINRYPGIKVGHLMTDPPFLAVLMIRFNLYELLNSLPIDFVVSDLPALPGEPTNFFLIPGDMGYGIKNYRGIRFAVLASGRDSLTMEDRVKIAILQQRSDILWIIDEALFRTPAMQIDFLVRNRALVDTTNAAILCQTDSLLLAKIRDFRKPLDEFLARRIYLTKGLDESILSRIGEHAGVNVVLYPEATFKTPFNRDSVTLREIINNVTCDLRLSKVKMTKDELLAMSKEKGYRIWGKIEKRNVALVPNETYPTENAAYLFDLFYKEDKDVD